MPISDEERNRLDAEERERRLREDEERRKKREAAENEKNARYENYNNVPVSSGWTKDFNSNNEKISPKVEEYKFTGVEGNRGTTETKRIPKSGSEGTTTVHSSKVTAQEGNSTSKAGKNNSKVNAREQNDTSSHSNKVNVKGAGNKGEGPASNSKVKKPSDVMTKAKVSGNGSGDGSDIGDIGRYNQMGKPDTEPLSSTVVQTVQNQYNNADAKQGYRQLDRILSLYGGGTMSRSTAIRDVENRLYSRDVSSVNQYLSQNSQLYSGNIRTGNVVNDYYSNLNNIYNALAQKGINAQHLSVGDIDRAIRNGRLEGILGDTFGNSINLNGETSALLGALRDLKTDEGRIRQIARSGGGIKNTAKGWVKEGLEDSDAYQGYNFAKRTYKAVTGTGKVMVSGAEGAAKVVVNAPKTASKVKLGLDYAHNKVLYNMTGQAQYHTNLQNIQGNIRAIDVNKAVTDSRISAVLHPVNTVGGMLKRRLNTAFANRFPRMHLMRLRMNMLRNTLHNNIIARTIRAPFSIMNAIKRQLRKFVLLLGLLFLIIAVCCIAIISLIPQPSSVFDFEFAKDETVEDSTAQKTINFLYTWQEAYTENTFEAESGSVYSDKGIPDTWKEQILNSDETIADVANNASVYNDDGSFVGFNFFKYWGQRAWANTDRGYDSTGENRPVYTTSITSTWEVGDDDGYTTYESHTVTLNFYGNAGLEGDIGDYDLSDGVTSDGASGYSTVKDCWRDDVTELNFNINGGEENPGTESSAYNDWADKLNEDVTLTFNYMGSKYSFVVTGDKYSYYINSEGNEVSYDIDEFYKGLLTIALGFTDNAVENTDFYAMYAKEVFDAIMERATVTLIYEYEEEDAEDNLTAEIDVDEDDDVELTIDTYYKCNILVNIMLNDCGLMDMMYVDSLLTATESDGSEWTHNGDEGNDWAHYQYHTYYDVENGVNRAYPEKSNIGSTAIYDEQDTGSSDYNAWYTEYVGENQNPKWGMTQTEHDGTSELDEKTYPDGVERNYTNIMLSCIEYYDLSVADWEDLIEGIAFPSGWGRALNNAQIQNILEAAIENGLNPEDYADLSEYLQYVLSTIGKYSYLFGAGHSGLNYDTYSGYALDCSSYISMLLQASGKLSNGTVLTTSGLRSYFGSSTYSGDYSSLSVGDLLFKTGNGSNSEKNDYDHVVMFVGYLQLEGDDEPVAYCVECTSSKGAVLTPASKFSSYSYVAST